MPSAQRLVATNSFPDSANCPVGVGIRFVITSHKVLKVDQQSSAARGLHSNSRLNDQSPIDQWLRLPS